MARGKGFAGLVGWKKGATWGTAVVPVALDGIWVKSLNWPEGGLELVENLAITGNVSRRPSNLGNHIVSGSIAADLPYEGLDTLIAQVLGTAGAPTTVDTTAKQHLWKTKDDLDGIFGTLAWEIVKDTEVYEVTSVKLTGLTIRGSAGQNIEIELRGVGHQFKDDSAANTTTTIDVVTVPANSTQVAHFKHALFWMNAQTGAALDSTMAYYIDEFELTLDRALAGVVTSRFTDKIDEPHATGFTTGTLRVKFAHLQDGTGGNLSLIADQLAGTAKKAKLNLTSPNLAGAATQKYQFDFWMPYLLARPASKPQLSGPGIISWQQEFDLHHVTAVPTGFTAGYTGLLTVDTYNQRAADALV